MTRGASAPLFLFAPPLKEKQSPAPPTGARGTAFPCPMGYPTTSIFETVTGLLYSLYAVGCCSRNLAVSK